MLVGNVADNYLAAGGGNRAIAGAEPQVATTPKKTSTRWARCGWSSRPWIMSRLQSGSEKSSATLLYGVTTVWAHRTLPREESRQRGSSWTYSRRACLERRA